LKRKTNKSIQCKISSLAQPKAWFLSIFQTKKKFEKSLVIYLIISDIALTFIPIIFLAHSKIYFLPLSECQLYILFLF